MNKIEFLSMSLPYRLYIMSKDGCVDLRALGMISKECNISSKLKIKEIRPVIRQLSDITKPCVQSDYNDGEQFVPITELLKFSSFNTDKMSFEEQCSFVNPILDISLSLEDATQLIKWHFWPNMPEGEEVVYVTDEFNPYKS